jgi:hypothetical protein
VDNPISKKDPSGRDDAGVVNALPSMLELLGGIGLAGTSELWGPVAVGVLGTAALINGGDAAYNLYHDSANPAPGLPEAIRLVSGDNENRPININPKGPKFPTTAVLLAAAISLPPLVICGEAGGDVCLSEIQAAVNYLNGNTTNTNANLQAPLLTSTGSGTGTIGNWSFSQLKLYTTPSGAVVRSDGITVSGPPGSGSGSGGGYISSNGQAPVKNSNGSTSYCLGVCKQQ